MLLHEDQKSFSDLVQATAEAMHLPQVYIEKDYWITKALKHLSKSEYANEVVFKGGTSLSKAYRLVERFSEDIDLAVFTGEKVTKSLLRSIESTVANGLTELKDDSRISKGSKYRKTVYKYPRSIDGARFGQASSELLIEVNSFTHPDPNEQRQIKTLIAETLIANGRYDLITKFELEDFKLNVLSVKRTLVEKMLGIIKDSYDGDPIARLSNRIRHLYDICLILRREEYRTFVQSDEFISLYETCIADEKEVFPTSSHIFEKSLSDAPLFSELSNWRTVLETIYKNDFADLVFGEMPEMDEIVSTVAFLRENLTK